MRKKPAERGSARSLLAGAALLAIGGCLGIVLGSVLDAPRLLLRRLQEPVQSAELRTPATEAAPQAQDLEQYRALQREVSETPRPERTSPRPPTGREQTASAPAPSAGERAAARSSSTARAPEGAAVAEASDDAPDVASPAPGPSADEVIRSMAQQPRRATRARRPPGTGAPPRGMRVVQVGAFDETAAALAVVDRLRALGFDSYLSDQKAPGAYRHRVRVKPSSRSDAGTLAAQLTLRGFEVWVTTE